MSDELTEEEINQVIMKCDYEDTGISCPLPITPLRYEKAACEKQLSKLQSKGWKSPEQMKAEGWVMLDKDQSLPKCLEGNRPRALAFRDMLKANFRRIKDE